MAERPAPTPPRRPAGRTPNKPGRGRFRFGLPRRRWLRITTLVVAGIGLAGFGAAVFFWISYGRMIDARFGGEQRAIPRIFGRPFEIRQGRALEPAQLVQRLNDVGYAERPKAAQPGEFTLSPGVITVVTRAADQVPSQTVKVAFTTGATPIVRRMTDAAGKAVDQVTLEAPLLTALAPGQKRRFVPFALIPEHVKHAVLAIEDQRFYSHPGVDPIRMVGALITNMRGNKKYLEGASTITQQIIKNTFLTPAQTPKRKLQEQFMALVLDSRFTKDQILELYLNEVVLGQRGPFAIHGVGEASRIFFGKDVGNVSLAEAATIAGLIQQPSALNPFRNPESSKTRRNLVLTEMAKAGFISVEEAKTAAGLPLKVERRALEDEAPYFVDYVSNIVEEKLGGLLTKSGASDVYTTLDLHLQRMAQEAVAEGLKVIDKQLPKRKQGQAQVALVAIDPRTGEVLALVGGRGYNETQYNRAVTTRRQPGSIFKPFVYLAAFEKTADDGTHDLTPATVMVDEPTIFKDGDKDYAPANYKDEYGGPMTLRRALSLSRNIVTIKVAEATGYGRVADLWKKVGVGTPALGVPSIALGVFEASPVEMATAYTIFPNGGELRELRPITKVVTAGKTASVPVTPPRRITRPETTFLVTNMMRSVINEGTAAAVRSSFSLDAAGKTGTTNDQRDAWFAGFTPELLTIVWVGFDNNQPLGLSGAQAALPVWTMFTKRALAGRPNTAFEAPAGVSFVEIDKDTGGRATAACPRTMVEAFLPGTEPPMCPEHGDAITSALSRVGTFLKRIIR
ncbi:MAG TPA: PBP1A family penicillin-binding protein [Vicinamibacterales bacterium]|nr:PBP1A family penicillin-binding protein [Vicinamibacterales bacterium]